MPAFIHGRLEGLISQVQGAEVTHRNDLIVNRFEERSDAFESNILSR